MSGSASTLRVAGLPSGYPAEIDANVKIRWVDNLLVNMSERSTDLLKELGGPSQFQFNNPKVEWVEDDVWGRRPTHGVLAGGGTTTLTVTGQAHRYPVGTCFLHVADGEIVRVISMTDINTVELQRDVPGAVAEGAWAAADEVIVCGQAMAEDAAWVFRASAIFTLPYNYAQNMGYGIEDTFRRQATALYGLRGTDLDYASANTVAEAFVAMEGMLIHGQRYEGASAARPSLCGGVDFYVTAALGAQVTSLAGVAMARKDIDDLLQAEFHAVGPEKMAKTVLCGAWGKRKIDSFFSGAERLPPKTTSAGVVISSFETAFGTVEVLPPNVGLSTTEVLFLNRDMIKMGNYEGLGRPHLIQIPGPLTGPYVQRAFYADLSVMVKGVVGMGALTNISTTS